ncbi:hypothetical protein JEV30_30180 [Pseudomonas aeruginosa]|nr:hypothetical protein [Pseudomonas aeruginosa]MBI7468846.1 hypothetical protein [Pseudomonas aeruginosa]
MIRADLQSIAANQDYLRLKRAGSYRKPGRLHLLPQFGRSRWIQRIAEQRTNLGRLGIELLCQAFGVVAVACERGFQVIQLSRQHGLDEIR